MSIKTVVTHPPKTPKTIIGLRMVATGGAFKWQGNLYVKLHGGDISPDTENLRPSLRESPRIPATAPCWRCSPKSS